MMGRAAGSSKGKGGSMHYYNQENRFFGGNGIVGAQVPVGAGLAFAMKYRNEKACAVAMYGDGAANQGQIYEAINMAYNWKLPIIFLIENNHFGMGTPTERAASNEKFYTRAPPTPGFMLDGMNVFAVREGIRFAKDFVINNGPIMLEFNTYRYHGHSMSDPGLSYRSKDEVDEVRKTRDPIEYLKQYILDNQVTTEEELKKITKETRKEVEKIAEDCKKDPWPDH
jgi:pyruvate dehydrogenase E1 component alpha subunit